MRVYVETYGCTLNQADSDIIKGILKKQHQVVKKESDADIIILNTCTVKGATENRILERIKKLVEKKKKIVIAGCLSVNEKRIREIASKAPIVWPGALGKILDAVEDSYKGIKSKYEGSDYKNTLPRIFTKPILRIPIQEGCTGNCLFCQTKLARPYLKSYSVGAILKTIKDGIRKGAKEIQLTGMDAGAYGLDIKSNLIELLENILEIKGEFFIRLGMINPNHAKRMKKDLIRIFKNKKMYKFIHLPVQTGSERVCKEMGRPHSVKDFVQMVKEFRKNINGISIATDIIVGYPTENEKDYIKTREMIKKMDLDIVNISKFSPRAGTKAKLMKQLASEIVKSRSRDLSKLFRGMAFKKNIGLAGRKFEVMITEKQRDYTGRNKDYKQVVVKNFNGKKGDKVKVKIFDANYGCLIGKL